MSDSVDIYLERRYLFGIKKNKKQLQKTKPCQKKKLVFDKCASVTPTRIILMEKNNLLFVKFVMTNIYFLSKEILNVVDMICQCDVR